ncbi:minor capsid protein, partial [Staphylococcus epidermidis]
EYEYHAKIDGKTTKTCRHLNNKVFKVKDMKPGVNAPPMHPFCRSAVAPHINPNWRDEFFEERKGRYSL